MGRLSEATLLAIASHKRPQAVLLYTPGDEWVSHMVKVYQAKARELGLQKVLAAPTDYSAANVHSHLPPELARHSEVNVTPGTHPQGTALGLWAKTHGVPAWALGKDRIFRLDDQSVSRPVAALTLKARLDFTLEAPVADYGWGAGSPGWSGDPFYDRMLALMSLFIEKGLTREFLAADIEVGGWSLRLADRDRRCWILSWPADHLGPSGRITLKDGHWYERLTAKAVSRLSKLGRASYDVACGVAVSAPGRENAFLTERDVLAANSKAQLFMISCKTARRFKSNVYKRILGEVEAMAKTLGRFVIPVVCDMTTNEPKMAGEVLVLGWTTLCRPQRLQEALEMAAKSVHG
jgi:hypothetical protein